MSTADYSEALEQQADIARRMATSEGKLLKALEVMMNEDERAQQRIADRVSRFMSLESPLGEGDMTTFKSISDLADVKRLFESALHAVQVGDTYACTTEISAWLETAARSIPDTFAIEPNDPPSPSGFFWTAAACAPGPFCVHAYSWHARADAVDGAIFGHPQGGRGMGFLTGVRWPYGKTLAQELSGEALGLDPEINTAFIERHPDLGHATQRIMRFWAAMFVFLHQRVFIATKHAAARSTRRRLERAGSSLEPAIRVVHLRRKMDEPGPDGEFEYGEHVHEWHWQWLVRGHWRNQYFPSQGRNRPLFVQPYVKGPKDKPLKPMSTTVYSVDR